jgi:predicted restriction endonuclease
MQHKEPLELARITRNSEWDRLRRQFLKLHDKCEFCGVRNRGVKTLVAHHVVPYWVDRTKELDVENLFALCEEHHFTFGHFCNWKKFNPRIREDAELFRARAKEAKTWKP